MSFPILNMFEIRMRAAPANVKNYLNMFNCSLTWSCAGVGKWKTIGLMPYPNGRPSGRDRKCSLRKRRSRRRFLKTFYGSSN